MFIYIEGPLFHHCNHLVKCMPVQTKTKLSRALTGMDYIVLHSIFLIAHVTLIYHRMIMSFLPALSDWCTRRGCSWKTRETRLARNCPISKIKVMNFGIILVYRRKWSSIIRTCTNSNKHRFIHMITWLCDVVFYNAKWIHKPWDIKELELGKVLYFQQFKLQSCTLSTRFFVSNGITLFPFNCSWRFALLQDVQQNGWHLLQNKLT